MLHKGCSFFKEFNQNPNPIESNHISGVAVLSFLETDPNPPDLLILDVMMPMIDGFEVARRMRQSTKFQFIPILLVTSLDEDYAEKALDIKIDGFIQKPIDVDVVIAQVQAILSRNS